MKNQTAFLVSTRERQAGYDGHFYSASQRRRKYKALPRALKNSKRFPTKMQGRKHVALRPFQERLFIIFLSAVINSSLPPAS